MVTAKNCCFLRFIPNNKIIINFFRQVFSEYTEAITTSLIPLEIYLPEEGAYIIGFSCTVWTEMRSLQAPELMVHWLTPF